MMHFYRKLRSSIHIKETQFEHVLFAAGSASYRTVDLVWLVFGFDPFGFRVCNDWDGGDFALGVVNGVLAYTPASKAVPLGLLDSLLCRPTNLRACPGTAQRPPSEITAIGLEKAYGNAEYLRQMTADGAVIRSFEEDARIDHAIKRTIGSLVEGKLLRLYGHIPEQDTVSTAVKEAVRRHTGAVASQQRDQRVLLDQEARNVDWRLWLDVYRHCLDDLVSQFGNPGHIFVEKVTAEMRVDDDSSWRRCDY
jgi:hypothetical protein